MLDGFLLTAQQVGILFALTAVGFFCRRRGLFSDSFVKGAVNLLLLIVTPCLIVHVFQRPFSRNLLANLAMISVGAVFAHAIGIAIAEVCFRKVDEKRKGVLKFGTVFSNAGFMAIPLEYALLGPEGAFYGAVYVAIFNVLCWTYGLGVMSGHLKDLKKRVLFVNPGTIGICIGLPLFLTSTTLPVIIGDPVRHLSNLNTPLAMIIIGYYLAGARFSAYFRCVPALVASVLRLVAIPLVVLGALVAFRGFGINSTMAIALTASACAPAAAMNSMFAAKYGKDVDVSAGLVSATTLLSIVTMPLIIGIAMSIFRS
ncbi:MAG: AEC family transporter [Kiritimatiellae bacterium]|nr:AEC family transporter [Kiritimatiellia bacterium]